eukprot:TRINITY_DN3149_c6_g1_i1.p1 TRINITY_DN3149_c6_g1~~TRINITY_DN3149_c6_g1_i1.p1  ORF type:complete len:759 (+),score=219.50 TRINITY_DN3149_c6_g1_i1:172-2448(+)
MHTEEEEMCNTHAKSNSSQSLKKDNKNDLTDKIQNDFNPSFSHSETFDSSKKRKCLTRPSEIKVNDTDNENCDLVVYEHDVICNLQGDEFVVLSLLGHGTFGQVFEVIDKESEKKYAIKVIKNKPAYHRQGKVEVRVLETIQEKAKEKGLESNAYPLLDHWEFKSHLCLQFPLLGKNLYDIIKANHFRGISLEAIRIIVKQILQCMVLLDECQIIHSDLKPENILLNEDGTLSISVIDFGSACAISKTLYSYVQSRFYRSPEVLVGLPYTNSIDMWSLGCIVAELYIGLPLFPGVSEYNQICRVIEMCGPLPDYMIRYGSRTSRYFQPRENYDQQQSQRRIVRRRGHDYEYDADRPYDEKDCFYRLKTEQELLKEKGIKMPPQRRYFRYRYLPDLIHNYPITHPSARIMDEKAVLEHLFKDLKLNSSRVERKQPQKINLSEEEIQWIRYERSIFINFIEHCLILDPWQRITPRQALLHPFVNKQPFLKDFALIPDQLPRDRLSSLYSSFDIRGSVRNLSIPTSTVIGNISDLVKEQLESYIHALRARQDTIDEEDDTNSRDNASPDLDMSPSINKSKIPRNSKPSQKTSDNGLMSSLSFQLQNVNQEENSQKFKQPSSNDQQQSKDDDEEEYIFNFMEDQSPTKNKVQVVSPPDINSEIDQPMGRLNKQRTFQDPSSLSYKPLSHLTKQNQNLDPTAPEGSLVPCGMGIQLSNRVPVANMAGRGAPKPMSHSISNEPSSNSKEEEEEEDLEIDFGNKE